jgi:hypothetical protein
VIVFSIISGLTYYHTPIVRIKKFDYLYTQNTSTKEVLNSSNHISKSHPGLVENTTTQILTNAKSKFRILSIQNNLVVLTPNQNTANQVVKLDYYNRPD